MRISYLILAVVGSLTVSSQEKTVDTIFITRYAMFYNLPNKVDTRYYGNIELYKKVYHLSTDTLQYEFYRVDNETISLVEYFPNGQLKGWGGMKTDAIINSDTTRVYGMRETDTAYVMVEGYLTDDVRITQYFDLKKIGKWVEFNEQQDAWEGKYVDGLKDGQWKFYPNPSDLNMANYKYYQVDEYDMGKLLKSIKYDYQFVKGSYKRIKL